ncbi:MAG: hypothetical protein WC551_11920 [Patescibacteria group bacterium]
MPIDLHDEKMIPPGCDRFQFSKRVGILFITGSGYRLSVAGLVNEGKDEFSAQDAANAAAVGWYRAWHLAEKRFEARVNAQESLLPGEDARAIGDEQRRLLENCVIAMNKFESWLAFGEEIRAQRKKGAQDGNQD